MTRLGVRPRGDGSNKSSLLLPNGARTRGFSGAEELYLAMRPILARSNGDVWLMSTPCGRRGFFFNTWLAKDRKIMSDRFFRQEYLCEFTDNDETLFPGDLINPAVDHDLKPLF